MSYISLYRKWRPRTFSDVKGQDAVVQTLRNQVKSGRTGHAYLFTGTRGTGKTSVAKILANAVNCDAPVDGEPCGKCNNCITIRSGDNMNVREIDAASNNGVDNVREIREEVVYPPVNAAFKVFIIDEVHMLSQGAFNALLKTLEEPPAHVIFILATTEAAKVPVTIMSRCQKYDFHRIDNETIQNQLKSLMDQEGIDVEDEALSFISVKADGAMRDALSLLDRCISFYDNSKITYNGVLGILGSVDIDIFSRMFRAIADADTALALRILSEAYGNGGSIDSFVTDFTDYLRNLLMVNMLGDDARTGILECSEENFLQMKNDSSLTDADTLSYYIREMSQLMSLLRASTQKRVMAEITLIKLTRPVLNGKEDDAALKKRLQTLEGELRELKSELEELQSSSFVTNSGFPACEASGVDDTKSIQKELPRELIKALPQDIEHVVENWKYIVDNFKTDTLLPFALAKAKPTLSEDGQMLEIVVESQTNFDSLERMASDTSDVSNKEMLRQFIAEINGGIDVPVKVTHMANYDAIQDITELVKIPITPDERKDEV